MGLIPNREATLSIQHSFAHHRVTPRRLTAVVVVGLAIAAFTLSGCAKSPPTGQGALGTTTTTPTSTGTQPTGTPTTTSTHTSGGGGGGPAVVFSVKQKPSCPIVGTSDAPFSQPGQDIVLQWQTSGGATGVALSIDDPNFFKTYHSGSYGSYGTSGTIDLAFQCDATVQPNTTHTYTLDTTGGGTSAEKTLTVTVPTSP